MQFFFRFIVLVSFCEEWGRYFRFVRLFEGETTRCIQRLFFSRGYVQYRASQKDFCICMWGGLGWGGFQFGVVIVDSLFGLRCLFCGQLSIFCQCRVFVILGLYRIVVQVFYIGETRVVGGRLIFEGVFRYQGIFGNIYRGCRQVSWVWLYKGDLDVVLVSGGFRF